ncbi:MAG: MFS transporter [Thermoguttaceae bacterium]
MPLETSTPAPQTLWNRGFIALLITQFTVAFNDNAFRWLLIPIGKAYVDGDSIRTLGSVFLLIPFLLLASVAGYVTDKFCRRNVFIYCKFAEIVILFAAIGFITMGPNATGGVVGLSSMPLKVTLLLAVLFFLGVQSAFFSPAKYSSIPDLVPETKLSAANGIVILLTMSACVSGQILGGYIFFWTTFFDTKTGENGVVDQFASGIPGGHSIWITILVLIGMAFLGFVTSFLIPKIKAVDPKAVFPRRIFAQIGRDLGALYYHRKLFWISVASAYFWGLGALSAMNIDKFASEYLMVQQQNVTILAGILSIGIGIGAVLCGYLSGKRIELGLVPIGAFGIGIFILLLGFTPGYSEKVGTGFGSPLGAPYIFAVVMMGMTGIMAGLYDIPLAAYIQKMSPVTQRGRMIAAYNFLTFSAMILFSILFLIGAKFFHFLNDAKLLNYDPSLLIWMVTGIVTLAICGVLFYDFLAAFWIFVICSLVQLIYRPKIVGLENIPHDGGVLLVSNHVSLLDGFLLYSACPRNIRFFAHEEYVPKIFECVAKETGLIKVLPGKKVVHALRTAREALKQGDVLGVFAEGGITRNGQMNAFDPGFLSMMKGTENVPVIPVHIHGLFGSMFSYKYGDKKPILWPRKLDNDVIISFGKPMFNPEYPMQVQRAVQELGVDSYREYNTKHLPIPARRLIETCRNRGTKVMFVDSTGINLSGYKFLAATLILRKLLNKYVLKSRNEEMNVGVLAPMSVGGCLLNAALILDRRVPVNLNFTFEADGINECIKQAGITHVLTSRKVIERFPDMKLNAEIICSEDLLSKVNLWTKIDCLLDASILPKWILESILGLRKKGIHEELCTMIYTSGSTGRPKGVMLTNNNISEVARSFVDAMRLNKDDMILGFLPLFHSFGFMGNFWLPIFCGGGAALHFSPLEPKRVGEIAQKYQTTFVASTPTFLRNFWRRCPKENFENAHTVMCGAEKLPVELMDAWQEKYGHRPGEGFGATELSPLPTTNVPDCRVMDKFHVYRKDGSVGRAVANVAIKIVDLETGADLPPNEVGMFVVKGPIVTKGYYKQPELTAEVIKNGWYITGDVGKIDEDGFIFITGRQTRISKIGGEMVPHILIEEAIQKIVSEAFAVLSSNGENSQESVAGNEPILAVTALPHPTRGERIIVLHRDLPISPQEIIDKMIAANMPRIWIPYLDGFMKTDSIPILGTGKLDLAALKKKAAEIDEQLES